MNKLVKVILIVIFAAILVFLALWIYFRFVQKNQVLDGPGSVYEWTYYELYSEWVETGNHEGRDPIRLHFSPDTFTINGWNGEDTYGYSLPEDTDTIGKPDGEVYLDLNNCTEFDNLIFHEEKLDSGELIPVLSGTIFEYDGRGEIIIAEFVLENDLDRIPADFRSSSCIERNDREAIPTVMMVDEPIFKDEPEEGDLLKNQTFYAKLPRSRYGGYCEEGDYAIGRFLIWLLPVSLSESGECIPAGNVAVPYIVSEAGNEENLCLLSGGNDGYYPYGDDIYEITTNVNGEIIDAVFLEINA